MPPDTALDAAARPDPVTPAGGIRGAVDNVGAEKIYGWAWHPDHPDERLRIEARLGSRVALTARADFARPDLPAAGIGDGNHAFEIKLTPECVARRAELAIVAVAADGSEAKLPFRVRRTPAIAAAEARRDVEQLVANQRALREEMRAAIAGLARASRGDTGAATAAMQVATTQARLEERLGTLDIWLARLDQRLAVLAEVAMQEKPRRRVDAWQIVLGAVLALAGGAGFAAAVLLLRQGWPG
ncbi:hypothetical protein [Falsiroseomonas sp.]|uniref:hypothetical protein n=1 Tax=Falsiroseomonas sp. TaxID=2870721 RepID=UPI0035650B8F